MWVDGSDETYQYRHNHIDTSSRNRDNGDLKYSLRSLEKHMPWWKGTLYIVTDNQIPRWLDISHPRVKIIDHIQIIPPQYLPTHVSNTIEWFLKDIPGIQEYFIAMNDDFLFLNPVEPSDLFTADGRPILHFNATPLENTEQTAAKHARDGNTWRASVHRSMNLLEGKIGQPFPIKHYIQHVPRVFSKTAMHALCELFAPELKLSLRQKERSNTILDTIYLATYHMAHVIDLPIQPKEGYLFRQITDETNFVQLLNDIQASSAQFLCLNDKFSEPITSEKVVDLYDTLFPLPTPFEERRAGGVGTSLIRAPYTNVNYTFVSFYSEGAPHDKGYALEKSIEPIQALLKGQCATEFYTPRRLRDLGYDYAVQEFAELGCARGNPNCEKLGFFAWKPLILWLELQKGKEGDVVMFHDFNIEKYPIYKGNLESLTFYAKRCLDECGFDFFVPRESLTKRVFHHAKGLTVRELGGCDPYYFNFPQAIVNMIFIRKTPRSMELIEEWMRACKELRWLTGTPTDERPHPGFIWHCPEQAILCVLLARWVAERKHAIPLEYPNIIVHRRNLAKRLKVTMADCKHLEYLFELRRAQPMQLLPEMPNLDCYRFVTFQEEDSAQLQEAADDVRRALRGKLPVTVYTPELLMAKRGNTAARIASTLSSELQYMEEGDILIFHELMNSHDSPHMLDNLKHMFVAAPDCLRLCGFDFFVGRAAAEATVATSFPTPSCRFLVLRNSATSRHLLSSWREGCIAAPARAEALVLRDILAEWIAERRRGIPFSYPNVVLVDDKVELREPIAAGAAYQYLDAML
jgi:hypothetical protein